MIAKQIKGKDFYGVLAYNQKKVDKEMGSILDSNLSAKSVVIQTEEFNVVRQLRPNLSKAVYHTSLNLPYSDKLSDNEFTNLAKEYLEGMGFDDNQYIVYKHNDQDHSHIHIVANRVKFSGEVVSDSQDFKRSEAMVRKLELKYNLTILVQKEESDVLSKGEIEKCLRTGDPPERLELQRILMEVLKQNLSKEEFEKKLKDKKVQVKFNTSSGGIISGISFEYKGIVFKGSKVNRKFSWSNIKNKLTYEQNGNHPTLHQDIGRISENQQKPSGTIPSTQRNSQSFSQKPKNDMGENEGKQLNKPKFRFRR